MADSIPVQGEEAHASSQSETEGEDYPSQPLMDDAKRIPDDDEEAWLELEHRIRKGEEARCETLPIPSHPDAVRMSIYLGKV